MFADKPLLIYLPGMEGTGKLFYRQEPLLSPHYTVTILPSRCESPFDYDQLTGDVLNAINERNAEKATIVGESFGGTVALQFALRHQDRVERLVLINTFPYFRRRWRLQLGIALLPLTFIPVGNAIRQFLYKTALGFEGVEKEDIQKLAECSFAHGYATSRNRMQLIKELDLRDRLQDIRVPVMIIAAALDKVVPSVKEANYMCERIVKAEVIILPEHGHTPLITPTFSLLSVLRPA